MPATKQKPGCKQRTTLDLVNEILGDSPLANIQQAVKIFGVNRSTIYRWIDEGIIEAVTLGPNCIRITRDVIMAKLGVAS